MSLQRFMISGLVCLLAYQAAGLSWRLIEPAREMVAAAVSTMPLTSVSRESIELAPLLDAALLGTISVATAQPVVTEISPKVVRSRQNIKLIGVVLGSGEQPSVAILNINNSQRVYSPGDLLGQSSSSKLLQVQVDRVVILVDGRQEFIELSDLNKGSGGVNPVAVSAEPLPSQIDLTQSQLKHLVGDYRTKVVSDPLSFGRFVQLSPYVENNRVVGYRLNAGPDRRLFSALGLKPGDLVTHVNHLDLADPGNLSKLIELVGNGGSLQVGIRRGSESIDVDVTL